MNTMVKRIIIILISIYLNPIEINSQTPNWADSARIYTDSTRWGKLIGYEKMAEYYNRGLGVQKSFLNIIAMYAIASEEGGKSIGEYFGKLDNNDQMKIAYSLMSQMNYSCNYDSLRRVVDVQRYEGNIYAGSMDYLISIKKKEISKDVKAVNDLIDQGLTNDDSIVAETAKIIKCMYRSMNSSELSDKELEEFKGIVLDIPVLGTAVGNELYRDGNLEKALWFFQQSDKYGFMTRNDAHALLRCYKLMESKGKKLCTVEDKERLENFANQDLWEDGKLIN